MPKSSLVAVDSRGREYRYPTRMGQKRRYDQAAKQFASSDRPKAAAVIALELCKDNVSRIRLLKTTRILGNYQMHPVYVIEKQYLDGSVFEETLNVHATQEEWKNVGENVIPVRSREVVDFGRLDSAVQGMVTLMARIRESGKEPSPEQVGSILASRQAIKTWQERAHAELATADSQVDLMETMFRGLMGDQGLGGGE